MSKLSVIMPVFNSEETLRIAIESVISQTFSDWELILVDDGSTDESSIICDKYAVKNDKIIVIHQKNLGVSGARNKGIEKATGNYLAFLDSDDYIDPFTYEKMMIDAQIYDADMIMCGYYREFYNNGILKTTNVVNTCEIRIQSSTDFLQNFNELFQKNYINLIWNKLYKRQVIISSGIRFQINVSIGEDLMFNIDFLKKTMNIYVDKQPFYHYVNNYKSITLSNAFDNNTFKHITSQYLYIRNFVYDELKSNQLLIDADIFIKNIFFTLEQYIATEQYNRCEFRKVLKGLLDDNIILEACERSCINKVEYKLYRIAIKTHSILIIKVIIYMRRFIKHTVRFRSLGN